MPKRRVSDLDDGYRKLSPPKKKRSRMRYWFVGFLLMLAAAALWGVPAAVQNRTIFLWSVNTFAGIDPLRVDVSTIEAGWFRPVQLQGLSVIDGNGSKIVSIQRVETENGLWDWIRDYSNLKTITLRDVETAMDVQPGTTTLEEALRPLLEKPSSGGSPEVQGRIRIVNALIRARDSIDLSTWELRVREADLPLPSVQQPIPAINLSGEIHSTSLVGAAGTFGVKVEPVTATVSSGAMQPLRFVMATHNLPLSVGNLVKRRVPELPYEQVHGTASLNAQVLVVSLSEWEVAITEANLSQVRLIAPAIVGEQPAVLDQARLAGIFQMRGDKFIARGAEIESDIASLHAQGSFPFDFKIPTAARPWIDQAEFEVSGRVDIAKLLAVAPSLVPLQDQAQITKGLIRVTGSQKGPTDAMPTVQMRVELDELIGSVAGTAVRWDQPLLAELRVQPSSEGSPLLGATCRAEFCQVDAQGELKQGQLKANLDLNKLQQRVSQFVQFPVEQLSGSAELNANWKQDMSNRISANGKLTTSPLKILLPTGLMNEPAWSGNFDLAARMDGGAITQIDRCRVELTSPSESLFVEIQEPISLEPAAVGVEPLPPATTIFRVTGDLGNWLRRGEIASGMSTGIKLAGNVKLDATGATSSSRIVLSQARFEADSFSMDGHGFVYQEPRLVAQFQGSFRSDDMMQCTVQNLTVQSESFAITAMDAPASSGSGRQGQGAFRADLRRLSQVLLPPSPTDTSAMAISGEITGRAAWTIDEHSLAWQIQADTGKVDVLDVPVPARTTLISTKAATPTPTTLWSEPWVKAQVVGRYDRVTESITMPETTLHSDWFQYGGMASFDVVNESRVLDARGQLAYDAAVVSEKFRPWTGPYIQISGRKVEPVRLTWKNPGDEPWTKALQAATQIGWDSANVIGIDVGKSEVPLAIENGQFLSATEIPVSQGALRWNLTSDLSSSPLAIHQTKQKVIENVAITPMMCQGWLKYVAPILAEVTRVEGRLSVQVDHAKFVPASLRQQSVAGQLEMHGATVGPGPLADQLLLIVQQVRAVRKGNLLPQTVSSQGTWLQIPEQKIDFSVDQGRVAHRNLQVVAGDIVLATSGSVDIDGGLDMIASVPIRSEWVEGTPALASLAGQSLQVPIRGTIQKPQVDLRVVTQLATQVAEAAVQGAVQKQIDKGLNKIMAPVQKQLDQLPSIPLPNLPTIPGLGSGLLPKSNPSPPNSPR